MPHNYLPLKENNQLELIEGRFELFPGIEVIPVHGHTDAMQLVKIRIGKESILYCADLMATAAHVPIHYGMGYDNYPMKVIEEKQAILEEAFKENTILFFEHDAHKIANSGKFEFEINFEKVVLIREKGKLYCFSRICPHMRRESMQKGLVRGNYIICPLHGHSFNLETGIPADRSKSTKDLKKFDVLETDDAIYVKEPEEESYPQTRNYK
jgi:nitrite reductase/ring-hydroxylating ferredoxin subunit